MQILKCEYAHINKKITMPSPVANSLKFIMLSLSQSGIKRMIGDKLEKRGLQNRFKPRGQACRIISDNYAYEGTSLFPTISGGVSYPNQELVPVLDKDVCII